MERDGRLCASVALVPGRHVMKEERRELIMYFNDNNDNSTWDVYSIAKARVYALLLWRKKEGLPIR